MNRKPSVLLGALCLSAGCISTESDVLDATEGCDEYEEGQISALDIDADAKNFVEATAKIDAAVISLSEEVFEACVGIATDLGADKTWNDEAPLKDRIHNADGTGACDAAAREIDERVNEVDVDVQVSVCEGECRVDWDAQAKCDAECAAKTKCDSGKMETRCEPAKISAYCSGTCEADAYCVGSVDVAANCQGFCEARCEGACSGTCYRDDGTVTENDAECNGHCTAECDGQCYGACQVSVEAGIACGAEVRCRGGCEGEITEPACTTEFTPPKCEVDTACYESCSTRIAESAECDPTTVEIMANVSGSPDIEPVVETLEKHLAVLYRCARNEGELIKHAAERMSDAGGRLVDRVDELDGKALACVTKSSASLSESIDTLNISIEASLNVKATVDVDSEQ